MSEPSSNVSVSSRADGFIRAAIVGAGYISEFHARAIRDIKGVELVGSCDPNLRRAQAFANSWRIPRTFGSLASMLEGGHVDCVHVLTPPDQHFVLAKMALHAGVHVFLEKPMCMSVTEADELVKFAEERGLYLGVSHNFMFTSAFERLRGVVRSKALGEIDHVTFNHFYEMAQVRFGPFDSWMLRNPGNIILETGAASGFGSAGHRRKSRDDIGDGRPKGNAAHWRRHLPSMACQGSDRPIRHRSQHQFRPGVSAENDLRPRIVRVGVSRL